DARIAGQIGRGETPPPRAEGQGRQRIHQESVPTEPDVGATDIVTEGGGKVKRPCTAPDCFAAAPVGHATSDRATQESQRPSGSGERRRDSKRPGPAPQRRSPEAFRPSP